MNVALLRAPARLRPDDPADSEAFADDPATSASDTELWVLAGQVAIVFGLFFTFRVWEFNFQLVSLGCFMATTACALLGPRRRLGRVVLSAPIMFLLWWWTLSYLWSGNFYGWRLETFRTIPSLIALTVAASLLPFRQLMRAVLCFCYIVLAFQVVYMALFYGSASANIDLTTGAVVRGGWRGSFVHKNAMAPVIVFILLTVAVFERRRNWRRFGLTIATIFTVMSQAVTGWGGAIAGLAMLWWMRRYAGKRGRESSAFVVVSIVMGLMVLAVTVVLLPALLALTGRDITLSGRTRIWSVSLRAISENVVHGYGVGGVWVDAGSEPTRSMVARIGFFVQHAHSTYIEILLLMGVVGLLIWLWIVLSVAVGGWRIRRRFPAMAQWTLAFAAAVLVMAVSEVIAFGPWMVLMSMMRVICVHAKAAGERADWDDEALDANGGSPATLDGSARSVTT